MNAVIVLAFVCAVVAMLLYGVASVAQAWAAAHATGADVVKHPAYLAGLAADGLAWAVSLFALDRLPIFVVQSILAGSLAVTVLLAIPALHVKLGHLDWIGVLVATVGILLVSLSSGPETADPASHDLQLALWIGLAVLVVLAVVCYRRAGAVLQGLLAGLGYGMSAIYVRIGLERIHHFGDVFRTPEVIGALVAGAIGVAMYARSLEHHVIGPPTAAMWVTEVLLPGAIGVAFLGDHVQHHAEVPAVLGIVLAIAGCVVLAMSPTQEAVGGH